MKARRIGHVTVVTPDAAGAEATFRRLFGFAPAPTGSEGGRSLTVGGARIELLTPGPATPLGEALAAQGEGMAALCLEVVDLGEAEAGLRSAGVRFTTEASAGGRTLRVDPVSAHGVRLTLVERR